MSQYENVNVDFRLRAMMGLEDQPFGLYAGSLYPGRGIEQILEAARKLTGVYFLCVGGRDFEVAQFRDRTRALDLRNVCFLGYVPNGEVPQYLLAADILLAPYTKECQTDGGTRTIAYASPMKLFEYMAAGKPIITSNIGAIPEVIRHEENGLLVTPGSVDDLVRATMRLLNDPPLARQLGARAREDARRCTWEARVTGILTFAGVG
jgi:glycosyltransferase involved in cell wall biosynthesis